MGRMRWGKRFKTEWSRQDNIDKNHQNSCEPHYHIVVDIEATCWKGWENAEQMETIEIGAVKLNSELKIVDEFTTYVRPIIHPILSDFCVRFTSITQQDVDQARLLPDAFQSFLNWIGSSPFVWYSWSDYDRQRLLGDLERHRQPIPKRILNHRDLKRMYAESENLPQQVGMRRALKNLGVEFEGRSHRGIDDAKNTAIILRHVLSKG